MPTLFSVDAHAAGEPCRVVTGGLPPLRGVTIGERRRDFRTRYDWARRALMREPRGHSGMFGALLLPPEREESAYGLVFFDPVGYLDGCGHGTLCSVAVWRRMIGEPELPFSIDNPDGSSTRVVAVEGDADRCRATLAMPPAPVLESYLEVPGFERASSALARCGNVYLLVEAGDLGIEDLSTLDVRSLRRHATALRRAAAPVVRGWKGLPDGDPADWLEVALHQRRRPGSVGRVDPERNDRPGATGGRAADADAASDRASDAVSGASDAVSDSTYSTAVVFSRTQVDRSPCGTGSCSLAAVLYSRGELAAGAPVRTVGPAGGAFDVRLPEEAKGPFAAAGHRFLLTGEADVTGIHEWILGDGDPLRAGFLLE